MFTGHFTNSKKNISQISNKAHHNMKSPIFILILFLFYVLGQQQHNFKSSIFFGLCNHCKGITTTDQPHTQTSSCVRLGCRFHGEPLELLAVSLFSHISSNQKHHAGAEPGVHEVLCLSSQRGTLYGSGSCPRPGQRS